MNTIVLGCPTVEQEEGNLPYLYHSDPGLAFQRNTCSYLMISYQVNHLFYDKLNVGDGRNFKGQSIKV